jgi:hypothetical protein
MTTMQEKLTGQFQSIITASFKNEGLEFVESRSNANTGTWFVMNGLDTLLKIWYSFGTAYATFEVSGPLAQVKPAGPGDFRWHRINGSKEHGYHYPHTDYAKGEELRRPLDTVRRLLTEWRAEEAAAGDG